MHKARPWEGLPNARHIASIMRQVQRNPARWAQAWRTAGMTSEVLHYNSGSSIRRAWDTVMDRLDTLDRHAVWDNTWDFLDARVSQDSEARDSAWTAISALVVYDEIGWVMTADLQMVKDLSALGDTRLPLMMPALLAMDKAALVKKETAPAGSR